MINYLVALLDSDSYKKIEVIQRELCLKYKLFEVNENLPMLHITLETIENPNLELLNAAIERILKDYSFIDAFCEGIICFEPPYKSVNLKISQEGALKELSSTLNKTLKEIGFNVRKDISSYELHISLANTYFSKKQWTDFEYNTACTYAKDMCCHMKIRINKLQLWKPINNESEMVVYTYNLINEGKVETNELK